MDERIAFVADYLSGGFTMTELCVRYNISRPTGYALVARYQQDGPLGLVARSRRPHTSPTAMPTVLTTAIVGLRRRHPDWGPVKLRDRLTLRAPDQPWPAASSGRCSTGGLVSARRRRRAIRRPAGPPRRRCAERDLEHRFQGSFGRRRPVVLSVDGDGWLQPVSPRLCGVTASAAAADAAVLERTFREYRLPARIRSDNGHPFAAPRALARLSRLAVWWIRLGIVPELTQPGCPSQNGRHERMHRTLKRATTRPPAATRRTQQRRFRAFVREYNEDRPHAALGGLTPSMVYAPSTRPWSGEVPPVTYPGHFEVRRVNGSGAMKWRNRVVSVSLVLTGEEIGLEERADGEWAVYFGPVRLGLLDERQGRIQPVSHDHGGALAAEGGSR